MADMIAMKTLTIGGVTFEITDETARQVQANADAAAQASATAAAASAAASASSATAAENSASSAASSASKAATSESNAATSASSAAAAAQAAQDCHNEVRTKLENGEFDGKSAYEYAKDGGYTGTEEEFAEKLASEGFADWDINDEDAHGYIKNRTHYSEDVTTELLNMTDFPGDKTSYKYDTAMGLAIGKTYKVVLDGTEYEYYGAEYADDSRTGIQLIRTGSATLNAPVFVCEFDEESAASMGYAGVMRTTTSVSDTVSLVIAYTETVHHPLAEDYLPDSAKNAVQYIEQTLIESQKVQARKNIGVPDNILVFDEQLLSANQQAQARKNLGITETGSLTNSFKELADLPFDARYCLRLEYLDAENDESTIFTDDRYIIRYHRVGNVLPTSDDVIGSVIEWSSIAAQSYSKITVTEDMIADTDWGTGFCVNCEEIWTDSTYPAPVILVLTEPSESATALGFTAGVYFLKVRTIVMVNEWAWGGEQRIHKELLPVGYPYFRLMDIIIPETDFDFSASTEVTHDAITLTKNEWYLVTCNGLEYVVRAKTLIVDSASAGIVLGDLSQEPFSIKVLTDGSTSVLYESSESSVLLSVRLMAVSQIGAQYLPPKLVVNVTQTGEWDSESCATAVMDKTGQEILDAFSAGWDIVCEIDLTFTSGTMHMRLPITSATQAQANFAGLGGAGAYYAVTTSIETDSVNATIFKSSIFS